MMKFKMPLEKTILIATFLLITIFKGVSVIEYFGIMKEFIAVTACVLIVSILLSSKNKSILDELKAVGLKSEKNKAVKKTNANSKNTKTFSFKISLNAVCIISLGPLYIFNFITLNSVATTLIVIEIIIFILILISQIVFLNNSNRILNESGEK